MVVYPLTQGEDRFIRWGSRIGLTVAVVLTVFQGAISVAWAAG